MFRYKVFRQLADHSFLQIAETLILEDAEAVYANQESGMISEVGGEILQTKNLTHHSDPALLPLKGL